MKCFVLIFIQLKGNYDLRKDPMELYSCGKEWQVCYSHAFSFPYVFVVCMVIIMRQSGRAKEVTF